MRHAGSHSAVCVAVIPIIDLESTAAGSTAAAAAVLVRATLSLTPLLAVVITPLRVNINIVFPSVIIGRGRRNADVAP